MAVPPDDLTCRELVELVTEYLEGALRPGEAARFEAHLAHCPACRDHVAAMLVTIGLVGRLTEERAADVTRPKQSRFWPLRASDR